jgi:hypothetical protein
VLLCTNTHERTLCKVLVASLCNHTSEVWYCAYFCTAWLGSKFFGTFTRLVVKVYNLCRVLNCYNNRAHATDSVQPPRQSHSWLGCHVVPARCWFCWVNQTPRADFGCEPLPCTGSTLVLRPNQETIPDFVLLFLPPCGPHLISFGHRVHRVEPTCLSTPRRPHRLRPFAPALHLHQHKSSRNLHLQYSAKSQSTPRC